MCVVGRHQNSDSPVRDRTNECADVIHLPEWGTPHRPLDDYRSWSELKGTGERGAGSLKGLRFVDDETLWNSEGLE